MPKATILYEAFYFILFKYHLNVIIKLTMSFKYHFGDPPFPAWRRSILGRPPDLLATLQFRTP